ncbi:alpha/beta fold hydrolase [Aquimarina macrocephali]|uniref:alpha/beta fold hydrolase n=1 Tax=Aquimarina macrocephali TaxID=666563 RepID=UPI000464BBED|nr:alpha/beta fold hydrolase [Aquimarina macrocephali]
MSTSKTFLLIHGAWEGAWAWKETTQFLERKGNKVISIDLPGHGDDITPISEINLDLYVNRVKVELNKFSAPVVLVAHSFAGYVISKVAEEVPQKIEKLIFIASAIPYKSKPAIKIFEEDKESEFIANLIFSEDQISATMNRETIKNIVFGGATDSQIDEVIPQLVEQATKPFFEIVETTEKNFGSVSKAYIETKHDRVLSLTAQRMLQKETGITESVLLDTGHVPLVTTPKELANALIEVS